MSQLFAIKKRKSLLYVLFFINFTTSHIFFLIYQLECYQVIDLNTFCTVIKFIDITNCKKLIIYYNLKRSNILLFSINIFSFTINVLSFESYVHVFTITICKHIFYSIIFCNLFIVHRNLLIFRLIYNILACFLKIKYIYQIYLIIQY